MRLRTGVSLGLLLESVAQHLTAPVSQVVDHVEGSLADVQYGGEATAPALGKMTNP
jgi:hypothetical protein